MRVSSTEPSLLGRALGSNASDEQGKAVMQDFTLVIPTYNRPKPLAALLKYLGAEQPPCRILSSIPASRSREPPPARSSTWRPRPSEMRPLDKTLPSISSLKTS